MNPIDPYQETMLSFEEKIRQAKDLQTPWIETTPEMVKYLNPRGLRGAKYFIYKGVRVCEHGMAEDIDAMENEQIGKRLFGNDEGVLIGRK